MAGQRAAAKAATRAKVLVAARAVFEDNGYDNVGMREIASRAGMSTGAVFGNFAGKAELYREIYGHDPISPEQGRALLIGATGLLDGATGSVELARAVVAIIGAAPLAEAA